MTKDEALTLALEALEAAKHGHLYNAWAGKVIAKCEEALAQPERPWVGLTDEEMESTCAGTWSYDPHVIARAIADKLKEKNT